MDQNEVLNTLDEAITAMAKRANNEDVASYAADYAQATMHLAEARAWVKAPFQPHGGGSVKVDSD